ncbi:hypothetical protein [Paraclostridium sordellii]|uniref:hypothetical protein n=1 Tax=Paraclostridium sordellii TaxID=1505 RepID=UPI0005E6F5A1|nr:hypothetical protein [Paeniclostridium sordellii]CEN21273.1 Uncharacterised protein [[Clostridium] sordellii] [Paeniclostridium sordellii]
MAKNENIKRVGLYFNLENEYDNKMWSYLNSQIRKPKDEIKRLIELAMEGKEIKTIEVKSYEKEEKEEELEKEEIDPIIGCGF